MVAWGSRVEDAYFKMEILDAYCRIVLVARQVSSRPNVIPAPRLRELLTTKQTLGMPDARFGLSEGELDARSGWQPAPASASDAENEALSGGSRTRSCARCGDSRTWDRIFSPTEGTEPDRRKKGSGSVGTPCFSREGLGAPCPLWLISSAGSK